MFFFFFVLFVSHQATNLSSNGSLLQDTREPKENRVRSMATQLLAKFESTPSYTVRNSQVKKNDAPLRHLYMASGHQSVNKWKYCQHAPEVYLAFFLLC